MIGLGVLLNGQAMAGYRFGQRLADQMQALDISLTFKIFRLTRMLCSRCASAGELGYMKCIGRSTQITGILDTRSAK